MAGLPGMLGLLEQASAAAPDDLTPLRRYARACVHVGDTARGIAALERLTAADPGDAEAWAVLSRLLTIANEPHDAVKASAQAARLRPDSSDFPADHGYALRAGHDLDDAARVFARAVELDPRNAHAQRGRGQALVRRADGRALERHCHEAMVQIGPSSWLVAQYLVALSLLGRRAAVAELLDYDRLVTERTIACPPGFASLDAFNAALRAEMHALEATRSGQTINDIVYQGLRIKDGPQAAVRTLGAAGAPASAALLAEFARAQEAYEAALGDTLLRRMRPKAATLTSEAIVTEERSHVARHTHACSWLSGVYYAAIPPGLGETGTAGCMEFGPPVHKVALPEGMWPTRLLRPRAGLMALFPGYVYHHVHANDVGGERIVITFDVTPTADSRVRDVSHETWLSGLPQE
jgi:tetratricopeptide (TPR) repeat protein